HAGSKHEYFRLQPSTAHPAEELVAATEPFLEGNVAVAAVLHEVDETLCLLAVCAGPPGVVDRAQKGLLGLGCTRLDVRDEGKQPPTLGEAELVPSLLAVGDRAL